MSITFACLRNVMVLDGLRLSLMRGCRRHCRWEWCMRRWIGHMVGRRSLIVMLCTCVIGTLLCMFMLELLRIRVLVLICLRRGIRVLGLVCIDLRLLWWLIDIV